MLKFLARFWRRGMDTYRDEGFDAFFEGWNEGECPYEDGSYAAREWLLGWNEAYNLPMADDKITQ